ncbi:ligase [Schaalia sp. 19OD2882]|uniref:O-antigen ligase family protein n=1 Tax=Schaalia sp. 19OD2882 TaxID=2794089 RepID=UPI001C1EB4CC|nr:ligase [Schaalia sp. 19OD2882]QWW19173.1 ligase [Schaalia sp. 19OD2882]
MRKTLAALDAAREDRARLWSARAGRLCALVPQVGPQAVDLGAWAFALPFGGYILWWVLGFGDMVWPVAALWMAASWFGVRGFSVPWPWVLWGVFVLWMPLTFLMLDTPGRLVGALYRYILVVAATVFAMHLHNARKNLPLRKVLTVITLFLVSATLGGYLAMAFPQLVVHTPLSFVLPKGLLANELVHDIAIRRTSQWNPNSYIDSEPRPSAPFLYANTWGNVYSLVLPLSLVHLRLEWALHSRWRWPVAAVIAASVVPAVNTLNRGMFIGLGVVALWVAVQYLLAGRWKGVGAGAGMLLAGTFIWTVSPAGVEFFDRLATTKSTVDRLSLYFATLKDIAESPVIGFGAPRPAPNPWLPALGTQGHFWTVLFSHGFVGVTLFVGFLVAVILMGAGRRDLLGAVLVGTVAATLVESAFYGMTTGLFVTLAAVALLTRGDSVEAEVARLSSPLPRGRSRGRASRSRRFVRG